VNCSVSSNVEDSVATLVGNGVEEKVGSAVEAAAVAVARMVDASGVNEGFGVSDMARVGLVGISVSGT
jgi:hypothetical protein